MKRRIVWMGAVCLVAFVVCGAHRWFSTPRVLPLESRQAQPPPVQTAKPLAYTAPSVTDVRLGTLVNREAPLSERLPDDISARIPKVNTPADISALHAVLRDLADEDAVRNAVADLLQRSHDAELPDTLLSVLDNPVEQARFRSFAVQHLGGLELPEGDTLRARITTRLHACLHDKDVEVRREALLALVRSKDPAGIATAVEWLDSPGRGNDDVRDISIRCVFDLNRRELLPKIRALNSDSSESVRIAAIVALSSWGDRESHSAFEACAASNSVRLQRAGQAALARLDAAPAALK